MSKWWHTLATIGLAVFAIVAPTVQTAITTHPVISATLAAVWAIIGHLLPSPVATAS